MSSAKGERPTLSVVIPFFNEEGAAPKLLAETVSALEAGGIPAFELLAVNDGSRDSTAEVIREAAAADGRIRDLHLPENRGQAAALMAGFEAARAEVIAVLDGDGQNDPADIPGLLAMLSDADMVVGYRAVRDDSWARRAMSRLANRLRGRFLRDHVRDSGCAIKVMRRAVLEAFIPIRTLYSFMPALAMGAGFRVREAPVRHRARCTGTSNYGLAQFAWRPALDMLGVRWFLSRRVRRTSAAKPGSFEPARKTPPPGSP